MTKISPELNQLMTSWRRHLHRYPEVEFDVYRTATFVADLLREWGLEVHEGIGQSGVVAVLRKGKNASRKSIALRADMDAMPIAEKNSFDYRSTVDNRMHACGHDGHCAMLLGAARHLSTEVEFEGTVNFIFQPNEEHGLGAEAMIDDGLFERFPSSECYAMHNLPGLDAGLLATRTGAIMASENLFDIAVEGRGGHASSPHLCIDPVLVSSLIVVALQSIVSRNADPLEAVVVSVTDIVTDGARNVIPSHVTIKGECRTFREETTDMVEERVRSIAENVAETYGAKCEISFSREFLVSVNSTSETEAAISAAQKTVGAERVSGDCPAKSFSEDFSCMQRVVPGCYLFIGNGTDGDGSCVLHNPHYDFNDDILAVGAAYWATLVEQQLASQ
jgi:amidohydrolase